MTTPTVVVYIVRHGETDENRRTIIQGQRDTVLNDAGRAQARQVGAALAGAPLSRVWSSDLQRAAETAEEIAKHHPGLEVIKQRALRERYMGSWEGKTIKERHEETRLHGITAGERGEESVADMSARVAAWWRENVDEYVKETAVSVSASGGSDAAAPGETAAAAGAASAGVGAKPRKARHVVVVSHGYFISLLLRGLVDSGTVADASKATAGGRIGNASVTTVELRADGRGELAAFADIGHLTGTQAWAGSKEAHSEHRAS